MRIYNKYIISLTLVSCIINSLLAFWGQDNLDVYFIINIIAYLVITLLYANFNRRAGTALSTVGAVFFAGFLVVVSLKAVEVLMKFYQGLGR